MEQQLHPLAVPSAESASFQVNAQHIATQLVASTGAQMCFLAYAGESSRRRGLAGSNVTVPRATTTEAVRLLQRAFHVVEPQPVEFQGKPALLVGLQAGGNTVGTALLTYADSALIDTAQVRGAAGLAGLALSAVRTIGLLHMQAGEIEERVRLREVQLSRNLIRGVIDSIPLGLALLDADGSILAANWALSGRFGLDPSKFVGLTYDAVIGPWHKSPAAQTFSSGKLEHSRHQLARPDGTNTLLEISSFPLRDEDGRIYQVVEVWEDITQRVALQTQLVRAEKLAAIGQLAASIAHEVGNPLQAIQGFLSLFLEQCAPDTPNRRFLELAEEEIERIVQVIARLRDLYRPKTDVVVPVDLNDLIEQVLLLTHKQLERSRVVLHQQLEPMLPHVHGVQHHLKQVLLNLVLNAAEAMPHGGTLRIQTLQPETNQERVVQLRVSDTGVGIPTEHIPRIFDGLHTSKEYGMGLGLYTSKSIIDQHMGRIDVQSEIGRGTTFIITLPVNYQEDMQ